MAYTVKNVIGDKGLIVDYQEYIEFYGKGARLSMSYLASSDVIFARSPNQTIVMARANNNTVEDVGLGLKLEFGMPALGETVYGFQRDPTGTVIFAGPVNVTNDHHGGFMASGFGFSVDFIGFKDAISLEAKFRPTTEWT